MHKLSTPPASPFPFIQEEERLYKEDMSTDSDDSSAGSGTGTGGGGDGDDDDDDNEDEEEAGESVRVPEKHWEDRKTQTYLL